MYTISMRPHCPYGTPNKCMNFEQERATWGMSTFQDRDCGWATSMGGLAFYSPLEFIDISVVQLAAMIAGLDAAYEELCNALYADAPNDLAKTPWKDLKTFMECIPRGLYETEPDLPDGLWTDEIALIPFLRSKELGIGLAWNGSKWGQCELPTDVDSYDSAGTCFGWDVLYKEEIMFTDYVRDPLCMVHMLSALLETLAWLNTDAKIYVQNIYSVQ